jgi:hypothetical protein
MLCHKHLSRIDSKTYCFSIWQGNHVTSVSTGNQEKMTNKYLQSKLKPRFPTNFVSLSPKVENKTKKSNIIKPKNRKRKKIIRPFLRKKLEQFLK